MVYLELSTLRSVRTISKNSTSQRFYIWISKFILLTRKDVIAQAISMYLASETDEWTSHNEKANLEIGNGNKRDKIEFNEDKILNFVNKLAKENAAWHKFFAINQADYLQVYYEDILKNTNEICKTICSFCDIESEYLFSVSQARYKKQGNNINDRFSNLF